MNEANITVLTNIIGAVEAGGQVYGNRTYTAYADPYANSDVEHTITLGWAQNYGSEAKKLVQMIYEKDPAAFQKFDTAGIAAMLDKDWVAIKWKPTAAQKKVLIAIIDSAAGHECQDALFAELLKTYISECEKKYTKETSAVMMYCEIRHLGGSSPVARIFDRLGGDYGLDAIMASLKKDQEDTSNNNQVGDTKYWTRHQKCREFIEKYAVNEEDKTMADYSKYYNSTGTHYISNSGSDENGGISGGTAGDQTGKEWQLRSWYNRPWTCVLRHPNANVRMKLAELACAAALNNKIGYDQSQRDTYWKQLKAAGYDPSKITVACESDCSAGVCANIKATGYLLGIESLQNFAGTYTGDMKAAAKAAGFTILTDSKYLTGTQYLLPGDILLNEAHHAATNITKGKKAEETGTNDTAASDTSNLIGSCSVTLKTFLKGASDGQVKAIQILLNAYGYKGKNGKTLTVDGDLGDNTAYAIEQFQKAKGMKNINFGTVAATTWAYLLNAK